VKTDIVGDRRDALDRARREAKLHGSKRRNAASISVKRRRNFSMCGLKSICDFRYAIYARIGTSRVNRKSHIVNVADITLKKKPPAFCRSSVQADKMRNR